MSTEIFHVPLRLSSDHMFDVDHATVLCTDRTIAERLAEPAPRAPRPRRRTRPHPRRRHLGATDPDDRLIDFDSPEHPTTEGTDHRDDGTHLTVLATFDGDQEVWWCDEPWGRAPTSVVRSWAMSRRALAGIRAQPGRMTAQRRHHVPHQTGAQRRARSAPEGDDAGQGVRQLQARAHHRDLARMDRLRGVRMASRGTTRTTRDADETMGRREITRVNGGVRRYAQIEGEYRYWLERSWDRSPVTGWPLDMLTFVMLNPSTADGRVDDPTIRRCIGFARRGGRVMQASTCTRCAPPTPPSCDPSASERPLNARGVPAWPVPHGRRLGRTKAVTAERTAVLVDAAREADTTLWCLGTTIAGAPDTRCT